MKQFRADMHIHSVLSPCADLEMSPVKIIAQAREMKLDLIAVTDHNHTGNFCPVNSLGRKEGIFVVPGVEVTTREEIHCLVYFQDAVRMNQFQDWMDTSIKKIKNDPKIFGWQFIVDEDENILGEVEHYLGSSLDKSLEEVGAKVKDLEGIFIPAHIDRPKNSILSQLGFIPDALGYDAIEVSWRTNKQDFISLHQELSYESFVSNSDSHFLNDIGRSCTVFELEKISFTEIKNALHGMEGRKTILS